jgi:hypothetical protein
MSLFEWGMEMARKIIEIKINRIAVIFMGLRFEEVTEVSLWMISKYDVIHRSRHFFDHQLLYQAEGLVVYQVRPDCIHANGQSN